MQSTLDNWLKSESQRISSRPAETTDESSQGSSTSANSSQHSIHSQAKRAYETAYPGNQFENLIDLTEVADSLPTSSKKSAKSVTWSDLETETSDYTIPTGQNPQMGSHPGDSGLDISDDTMEAAMAIDASAEGGGAGAGGGLGMRGSIEYKAGNRNGDHKWTKEFSKVYKLRIKTHPVEMAVRATTGTHFPASSIKFVKYPYHDLPVEKLGFYMTELEIRQAISEGSRVEMDHMSVSISTRTNILPFDIASTRAAIGNNNVGIEVFTMQNMRGKRFGIGPRHHDKMIRDIFWGNSPGGLTSGTTFTNAIGENPPAWLVFRNFENRFEHYAGVNPDNNETLAVATGLYELSWFNYNDFKAKRWNGSMLEGDCLIWEHKPKNKYLFGKNAIDNTYWNYGYQTDVNVNQVSRYANQDNQPHLNAIRNPSSSTRLTGQPIDWSTSNSNSNPDFEVTVDTMRDIHADMWTAGTIASKNFLSNYDIDTNLNWHDGSHTKAVKTNIPTCCIGMEPLLNVDAENSAIDNYFCLEVTAKCRITIHQNPSYIYPQLGTARYAPPAFMNPQIESGKITGFTTSTRTTNIRTLSVPQVTPIVEGMGVPAKLCQPDTSSIQAINVEPATRRSERLLNKPYDKVSNEKIDAIKKKLFIE